MAQKRNDQMEGLLAGTFQNRYEPNFAISNYLSILGSAPNLCAAWVGGHAAFEEARWYDWTPDLSDNTTLTLANVLVEYAQFCVDDRTMKFETFIRFDITAGANAYFYFRLPLTPVNPTTPYTVQVNYGAGNKAGLAFSIFGTNQIGVSDYVRANWTAGTGRWILVSGHYQI